MSAERGSAQPARSRWRKELQDAFRALSGAFMFGMPLLFTMEMWWLGSYTQPWKLLVLLGVAFVANLGLAYFAGCHKGDSLGHHLHQAIETLAIGAAGALVVLLVLNRMAPGDPLATILGKIVVQMVPLSIGAAVANAIFSPGRSRTGGDEDQGQEENRLKATLNDVSATVTGGVFIGCSIAPTEEIPMIASGMTYGHLLALVGLTLMLTYTIVFVSGFDPSQGQPSQADFFHSPLTETAMTYFVSLFVAAGALFLFNELDTQTPLHSAIAQTLVLGLPTAIGGAAGRLVI